MLRPALVASGVARVVPEYPRWARLRWEGPLQRSGSAAGAVAGVPGPRCGGAGSRLLEAPEAQVALGRRAVLLASG